MAVTHTESPITAYFEEAKGGYIYHPPPFKGGYKVTSEEMKRLAKAHHSIRRRLSWEIGGATVVGIALLALMTHDVFWQFLFAVLYFAAMLIVCFRLSAYRLRTYRREIIGDRPRDRPPLTRDQIMRSSRRV